MSVHRPVEARRWHRRGRDSHCRGGPHDCADRTGAGQRPAESVPHGGELLQAARRADVGLHQRRRDRQGRQEHLDRGAVRRELLPRFADRRSDHEVRRRRHFRQGVRRGQADLSARLLRRPQRQHLDHRRPGQRPAAAARARHTRRRAAHARRPDRPAGRRDDRPPGLRVQPRRQTADDARQARRRHATGYFYQPNAVLVAPNGDIFVSEGHGAGDDASCSSSRRTAS